MERRTGFTVCSILLICLSVMTLALTGTGNAYAAGSILLVNTIDRALSCTGVFRTWRDAGFQYFVDPAGSNNIPTWSAEQWGGGPLIRLWCMERNAYSDAVTASINFTYGGQYPAQCRVVRTDGYGSGAIQKMEIQCP